MVDYGRIINREVTPWMAWLKEVLRLIVLTCLFEFCFMGCASEGSRNVSPSKVFDLGHLEHVASYDLPAAVKLIRLYVVDAARRGDIVPARHFLMDDAILDAFIRGRQQAGVKSLLITYEVRACFFLVAINALPQVESSEVTELLAEYYYGSELCSEDSLSPQLVQKVVSQLALGPRSLSEMEFPALDIRVRDIELNLGSESNEARVRIFFKDEVTTHLWFIRFRIYKIHNEVVWMPVAWSLGGVK